MRRLRGLLARFKPSLLTRVAVALGIVGLAPAGFSAWRLIHLNDRAMTDQVENTHALAARTAAESVGDFLANRASLARSLADNPALADPRSPAARALLAQSLQAWAWLEVLGLVVVAPDGAEVIRAQLADPGARQGVEAALGLPPGEPVRAVADLRPPVLRLEAALPGGAGYLWVVTGGGQLVALLEAYELGEEAALLLAEKPGRVLVGRVAGLAEYPPQVVELAFSRHVSGVKPAFEGAAESELIGAYSPVPGAPWAVFSRQPTRVAHRVARQMARQATWTLAATALAIAGLLGLAWVSVVRPIRQVALAQRRLAGARAATAGGDEIDQLKAAFDALERSLGDREALSQVFLGRYQIVDILGSGAMGTVFKGWDPKLQRAVALKTVRLGRRLEAERQSELRAKLLKEAITVARFSHPHIVAVYDVEDRPEGAFVAMEYVDGLSLEMLVWRAGRLESERVIPLGAAIAGGLAAAHERGIVHRDVKPANVLLGYDGTIKVTDFGIAELVSSLESASEVVFGTPGYLPPETLQGKGYEQSGDLFSLGVVLYYALSGRRPFDGRSVKEIVRQTLFGNLTPLDELDAGVPAELSELVAALLHRTPAERPAGAAEVAERLAEMARAGGLSWPPPDAEEGTAEAAYRTVDAQWLPTTRLLAGDRSRGRPPAAAAAE